MASTAFGLSQGFSFGAPVRTLVRALGALLQAMDNRRAARALMHLDARDLKDMGLTPDAVAGAFSATSIFEDPTIELSRIAARRGARPAGRESAPPLRRGGR